MSKTETKLNSIDYAKIWENAKALLMDKTTALTYDVFVTALEPIMVRGDALILKAKTEGARSVIVKGYTDAVNKAIQQ